METNKVKELVVIIEKDFVNISKNKKSNTKGIEPIPRNGIIEYNTHVNLGVDFSQEMVKFQHTNDDVVEIFAHDIIDISDDDIKHVPVVGKWEDDEWYGISNKKYTQTNTNKEEEGTPYNSEVKMNIVGNEENVLRTVSEVSDSDKTNDNNVIRKKKCRKVNYGEDYVNNRNDLSGEEKRILKIAAVYICSVCQRELRTNKERSKHRIFHELRYLRFTRGYRCPECSRELEGGHSYTLQAHYQKEHSDKKLFCGFVKQCPECPYKAFGPNILLTKHMLYHNVRRAFKCDYCAFSHNSQQHTTKHMKLHSEFADRIHRCKDEVEWFYCSECPYRAKDRSSCRRHMLNHKKREHYKCPQCTYSSRSRCR